MKSKYYLIMICIFTALFAGLIIGYNQGIEEGKYKSFNEIFNSLKKFCSSALGSGWTAVNINGSIQCVHQNNIKNQMIGVYNGE